MPERRIITAGLHVIDILGRPISAIPEGQGIALIDEIRMTVAGTAAATAVDLARLGMPVSTCGVVGDDALGQFMRDQMEREGVRTEYLRTTTSEPTSATILTIRPDGSRPAMHAIGSSKALEHDDFDQIDLENVSIVHLGGVGLLPGIDSGAGAALLRRARDHGAITTLDFIPSRDRERDCASILPCLPWADIIMPSEEDAAFLSGSTELDDMVAFFRQHGASTVIITRGEHGAHVATPEGSPVSLSTYDVPVVDTTGCGDAFSAGLIAALHEGETLIEAVEWGLACGALVATGLGSDAGLVDRDSLGAMRHEGRRRAHP